MGDRGVSSGVRAVAPGERVCDASGPRDAAALGSVDTVCSERLRKASHARRDSSGSAGVPTLFAFADEPRAAGEWSGGMDRYQAAFV